MRKTNKRWRKKAERKAKGDKGMESREAWGLVCPMAALMSCCWSQALADAHPRSAGLRSTRSMSKHQFPAKSQQVYCLPNRDKR